LRSVLSELGVADILSDGEAAAFWLSVRDVAPLNEGRPLWRVNVRATEAPGVTAALRDLGASWYYDWAGGLIWLTMPYGDEGVNAAVSGAERATSASNAVASATAARVASARAAALGVAGSADAMNAASVRRAAEKAGGHAVLVRASAAMRAAVPALHPEPAGVAALAQRIKTAFDPAHILDPARFSISNHAN
jgi:glycolate oxidase FAD binding subunit